MTNFFGDCLDPQTICPACPGADMSGVTINYPQFGESGTRNANACCSKAVTGGLMNVKNYKTYASSFTILKKSLTTVSNISGKSNIPAWTPDQSFSAGYIGGPGDAVKSVPIITAAKSGWKARLTTLPHQTGVDVKHGSYERYLAQKRGFNMRCQLNCA